MKKAVLVAGILLCSLCLCSCGEIPDSEQAYYTEFELSNLADESSRMEVADAMSAAGISEVRQEVFFDHVSQVNEVFGPENLFEGFETAKTADLPLYDPYELQDKWAAEYPDFMGYNCRITAYGLFGDFLSIEDNADKMDLFLAFDIAALEADGSVLAAGGSENEFCVLFSTVPTDESTDVSEQAKAVKAHWAEQGVCFTSSDKLSLIIVMFHDKIDENDYELFAGHVGVLIDSGEGELCFVEKLAFQEPYQAVRVKNRTELNDYLMSKYGDTNETTAAPFIMENDRLMEGYRMVPTE